MPSPEPSGIGSRGADAIEIIQQCKPTYPACRTSRQRCGYLGDSETARPCRFAGQPRNPSTSSGGANSPFSSWVERKCYSRGLGCGISGVNFPGSNTPIVYDW